MNETSIYDAGTNHYYPVTGIQMVNPQSKIDSLEGTHRFFPGNSGEVFRVLGFSFSFPEDFRGKLPEGDEVVVFLKPDGKTPQLVAFGIVKRVASLIDAL